MVKYTGRRGVANLHVAKANSTMASQLRTTDSRKCTASPEEINANMLAEAVRARARRSQDIQPRMTLPALIKILRALARGERVTHIFL